jgi:hypothetical protein
VISGSRSKSWPSGNDLKIRAKPPGLHLFSRTTGLNVLIDEVMVPCHLWAKAPAQVSIALTNACDPACCHCYAPKKHAVLDFADVTTWLDELDANDCIGVGFGGGEPTLYPRLIELCSYAAEKTRLAVTMTTHGHHLRDSLIAALSGKVHFIRVSTSFLSDLSLCDFLSDLSLCVRPCLGSKKEERKKCSWKRMGPAIMTAVLPSRKEQLGRQKHSLVPGKAVKAV